MVRSAVQRCAWLLVTLAGCASHAPADTEIVLVVTTDLDVPEALDGVRVAATGPDGVLRSARATLASPAELPVSLRLARREGPLAPLHVEVHGQLGGDDVLLRTAELAFVAGERRVLRMALLASCVDVACAAGLTCTETGCASSAVPSDELPRYDVSTFAALGEPPEPAPASADPERDAADAPPSDPDADAEQDPSVEHDPDDAARDAGADLDAAPAPSEAGSEGRDDSGTPDASVVDAATCPQVLVCRGFCVPLTLPGLCTCALECAPEA